MSDRRRMIQHAYEDVWKSAKEWAGLGLPGVPASDRGIQKKAKREAWPSRKRAGSGGGLEYPLSALPAAAIAAYRLKHEPAREITPVAPAPAAPAPADVTAWQIACRDARLALLAEVDAIRLRTGLSARQAILTLVQLARAGQLRPELQALIGQANAKAGKAGRRTLSRASLYDWLKAREEHGPAGLLPKGPAKGGRPAWAPYFLKEWRDPRNPGLADVLRRLPSLLPEGMEVPSYDQARRFLQSLPPQEREKGRKGPRAMVALRAYKKRTTDDLEPTSIYTADGKLFPAEVCNPLSGLPFKPELTTVLDVATRRAVGWSAALSENASGVTDALRQAVLTGGVPAIWYTDNGPGFDNIRMDAPLTGILARLGTVNYDSLPDRSHSRGIIERFQQEWNRAAKRLPTYSGHDVDPEYKQIVHKVTRREIKQFGAARAVMAWDDFLRFCQDTIDAYNARPHSGLPKTTDPVTGKRRHMTPNEAWAAWEARGWQPVTVSTAEADDLFRSYELRKTKRALVTLGRNEYHHMALEPYHGKEVAVGYDIHDASHVWVREVERTAEEHRLGRLICVAEWNAHATRYVPVSMEQQGKEQRVKQQVRRLDDKRDRALAQLDGPHLVEHQTAEPAPLTIIEEERAEAELARLEQRQEAPAPRMAANGRPNFASDTEWAAWVLQHPDAATSQDGAYLREKLRSRPFRDLCELEGVDVLALQQITEQLRGVA